MSIWLFLGLLIACSTGIRMQALGSVVQRAIVAGALAAGFLVFLALGIGVVAVSWSAIIIREAEAPVLVIASYRMVLAALPVGALALIQQRRVPEPISRSTV